MTERKPTDEPNHSDHPRNAARHGRLRDALRENLKRRKMQSRGRASLPDQSTVADAAADPVSDVIPDVMPAANSADDISVRDADPEAGS